MSVNFKFVCKGNFKEVGKNVDKIDGYQLVSG